MKYNRFFRILTVAIILSLLMIAIPATPALAASVTLDPEKGEIGSRISIEGAGFSAGVGHSIYFSSQEADTGDEIDDEVTAYEKVKTVVTYGSQEIGSGTFPPTAFFDVPDVLNDGDDDEVVHGGTYYIYTTLTGDEDIITVDDFTVIGIEQLTPAEAPVGTRVGIDGVGFEDREDVSIEYDGVEVDIDSGDRETESDGDFTSYILVPESTAGVHTITAIVEGVEGEFQFTVEPEITISPTSGAPGDQITVTGTGFGNKKDITITFDGDAMDVGGDDDTDAYGSFESTFNVPSDMSQGTYEIEVKDTAHNKAEAEFSITTSLTLSLGATAASPGYVGDEVTVSGSGFRASWQITITYASTPVVFITNSLSDGSFSYTFEVPPSSGGAHIITVTDGENTDQVSFFMETTPPSGVFPLLPLADSDLEDWKFDWCGDADDPTIDVTDDSLPITYDFQIATDSQFSTPSLLLSKVGLTTSKYTLTVDEKLESNSEEAPYYWRVRAVDAAFNVTAWTDATPFHVGFIFTGISGWLLYLLIAIGVIGAFVLGFWLGRRTPSEEYY